MTKVGVTAKSSLRLVLADAEANPGPQIEPAHAEKSPPADAGDYMFHLMVVISRLRDAELDRRLAPLLLTVDRYRAMAVMEASGPCSMSTFTSYSPLDRTTNSRLVDQLVRVGWVLRSKASADRRQNFVSLTQQGREICRRARSIVSKFNAELIEGIDEELQSQVIAAQVMLASKLEPRRGQFVDRQDEAPCNISDLPIVS